ncbi:hypothetical protein [Massilia soli]|uniref:Uncharacterized protein n=1 Tax=Massilia soli TaxID=2792854 RepID=A0ABS7SHT8_9BURK|nr:hypothetical protein [Massilia soli]MBZ2205780.1 hypothetical protein [Massilia soli]
MRQVRKDRHTALKVERGLLIQRCSTTQDAAQYLLARGVPMDVSVRVLTTTRRRDMNRTGALPEQGR